MAISHKITKILDILQLSNNGCYIFIKGVRNFFLLLVACNEMMVLFAAESERDHSMSVAIFFKYIQETNQQQENKQASKLLLHHGSLKVINTVTNLLKRKHDIYKFYDIDL